MRICCFFGKTPQAQTFQRYRKRGDSRDGNRVEIGHDPPTKTMAGELGVCHRSSQKRLLDNLVYSNSCLAVWFWTAPLAVQQSSLIGTVDTNDTVLAAGCHCHSFWTLVIDTQAPWYLWSLYSFCKGGIRSIIPWRWAHTLDTNTCTPVFS